MTLHVVHTKWYHPNGVMVFTNNLLQSMRDEGVDFVEHEGWRTPPEWNHFGLISMTASTTALRMLSPMRKPSLSMALTVPGTMQYVVDLGNPDGRMHNIGEWVQQRYMDSAIRQSESYLTNTRSVARALRKRKGTKGKNILTVPIPVDPVFYPRPFSRNDHLIFLTIGKLTERREGLLLMPHMLREAFPDDDIELITVSPWCENIEKLTMSCIANRIYHARLPPVDNRNMWNLYVQADCYLYVSTFEGYSMTPREALACGTPCLISHNEVHDEVYTGKPGVVFLEGIESVRKAVEMGHRAEYSEWARCDTWKDVTETILSELELE